MNRMTPHDVRTLVEREIGDDWTRTNLHNCDLRRCLVEPHVETFDLMDNASPPPTVDLWVVLEERPDEKDGYKVVFDEATHKFGLALDGETRPYYVGSYGTFLKAFKAM